MVSLLTVDILGSTFGNIFQISTLLVHSLQVLRQKLHIYIIFVGSS